jgi:type I restriction enzyme R subunit
MSRIHDIILEQFRRLGYTLIDGSREEQGPCAATGRASRDEVVLLPRLRAALRRLNPQCSDALIESAIGALTVNRSLRSLAKANREIDAMLRDGVKIDARGQAIREDSDDEDESEQARTRRARERRDSYVTLQVIDWRPGNADNNDFTLVSHFWVNGKLGRRCLDLVAFVNGLPWVLLEITEGEIQSAFSRIDQDYKANLPALFWYNAFIVVASPYTARMGSLSASWEHFAQWKRVNDEREPESTRPETLIEGTCQKARLLDIVENFTLFDDREGLKKLIARNHQYLGVNNAIAALRAWQEQRASRRDGTTVGAATAAAHEDIPSNTPSRKQHGKLGVFWHTQGSGKSYSMIFFVRKVQRTISSGYTFLVVTDRDELDEQIVETFTHTGAIDEDAHEIHASSAQHLKRLLAERHLLLFTLIQKFRSEQPGQDYEEISANENIIVIADEAHRSQYDTLAKNMRDALPRAAFIGFTGTPLMDGEEQTRETFGDYVSIYNFRRAINDGITVPLYYENQTPQVELTNLNIGDDIEAILDDAMLNEQQKQKVSERSARAEEIFVNGARLDQIAEHIVEHFMSRGYMGKAMVVCLNKLTAVRTYNRVRACWERYRDNLCTQKEQESDPERKAELAAKIDYMEETKMAVVVSASPDDEERFAKFSRATGEQVDIIEHHRIFNSGKLAEDFKNPEHELRIAFVCGMWITGFDVPCLSTVYLDRLLKGHTLMQTIARANRVYDDKINGLIVDYAGTTTRTLPHALAIYAREDTSGYQQGDRPIGDKSELVQALRDKLRETAQFCREQGIDIDDLLAKVAAEPDRERQKALLQKAVDALLAYDEVKMNALLLIGAVSRLYRAILPDASEPEFTLPVHCYQLIKSEMYAAMHPTGVEDVLGRTKLLVREAVEVREREERLDPETLAPRGVFDLRDVDLSALESSLRSGYRHINLERLRYALAERIKRMIEGNPTRVGYMEKLQRIIDKYNEGCANQATDPRLIDPQEKITQYPVLQAEREKLIDEYASELIGLAGELEQEGQRAVQAGLSEEELTICDFLTAGLNLDAAQQERVKEIARTFLTEVRPVFAISDWQIKPDIASRVDIALENAMSALPPELYSQEQCQQRYEALSLYLKERHKNGGSSVA